MSPNQEILDLYAAIAPGDCKDVIDDWRLLTLHLQTTDRMQSAKEAFLLGMKRSNGNPRITSDVVGVDLDRSLVTTRSGSLYHLGIKGEGEPPLACLALICSAFHYWGYGAALGVPTIII